MWILNESSDCWLTIGLGQLFRAMISFDASWSRREGSLCYVHQVVLRAVDHYKLGTSARSLQSAISDFRSMSPRRCVDVSRSPRSEHLALIIRHRYVDQLRGWIPYCRRVFHDGSKDYLTI